MHPVLCPTFRVSGTPAFTSSSVLFFGSQEDKMHQSLYFSQPAYKDRRGWLIAFGVVEILIACFLAMMAAFMVFAISSLPRTPQQPPMPARSMVPAVVFYLALAAGFVALGIGSIRAREWARIAMIVVSSIWMAFGVIAILFVAVLMPTIIRQQQQSQPQQLPEGFQTTMMTVVIGIQAIFMVVLPLVFLLFYCNRNVKATLRRSHPVPAACRFWLSFLSCGSRSAH
jgi:hypothetical protein